MKTAMLRSFCVSTRILTETEKTSHCVTTRFAAHQSQVRRTILLWPLSGGNGSNSNGGGGGQKKKWWKMSFETKVVSSLVFGAISYYVTSYFEKQHAKREVQLELITRQIRDLYGPLYGNRLVQETSYKGVVGEHKHLKDYLKKAEQERNAEMIHKWRTFVYNVLYPLDKEAQDLLCKNAHLVATDDFPEEFKLFLTHFARLQFVMEEWKKENGKLEATTDFTDEDFLESTNASGQVGLSRMLDHVEEKCKELRMMQKRLIIDISAEENEHFITGFFKKYSK